MGEPRTGAVKPLRVREDDGVGCWIWETVWRWNRQDGGTSREHQGKEKTTSKLRAVETRQMVAQLPHAAAAHSFVHSTPIP